MPANHPVTLQVILTGLLSMIVYGLLVVSLNIFGDLIFADMLFLSLIELIIKKIC